MFEITLSDIRISDIADLDNWHKDDELAKRFARFERMFNLLFQDRNQLTAIHIYV